MRRAISVLLILAVAALAVTGCGSGGDSSTTPSQAEYKQTYQALSKELTAVGTSVGDAMNQSAGKSNKQLETTFADLADRTRALAKKIGDTTPPANPKVKAAQEKLAAGLNTAADDLEAISTAAGKKNLRAAGTAAGKLARDNSAVSTPHRDLDLIVLGIKPAAAPKQSTTTTKQQ